MANEPLSVLRPALDRMTPAQQDVIKSLNPEELKLAAALHQRLEAVAPEVEGQGDIKANSLC